MHSLSLVLLAVFLLASFVCARDYYEVLDVPRDAQKAQIKRHYKKLSRVYHPDKNPGDDTAQQKFMELANAYEVLMDDEKRGIYDRYGEDGLKQNQGGGRGNPFNDPFDIFSHFFGGGGGRQQERQENRGPDIALPLEVTLEDLYNGANIEVDVSKQVVCDYCHGSGANRPEDIETCGTCGGHGIVVKRVQIAPGMVQQFQQHCGACGGKGKTIKHICPSCSGNKVRRGNEDYTVRIERGMEDGQTIVFEEESDEYPDTTPGNIVFVIQAKPHAVFEKRGNNLYSTQHITLIEALTGFSKKITHLDHSTVELFRDGITQYGFVQTIKGQGMPLEDNPHIHGDLFVEYQVVFPTEIEPETIDYLRKGSKYPEHQEL